MLKNNKIFNGSLLFIVIGFNESNQYNF